MDMKISVGILEKPWKKGWGIRHIPLSILLASGSLFLVPQKTAPEVKKMNKVTAIRIIVKLYFLGAVAGSFMHIITAAEKVGLSGWEAYSTPFMIDGLAVIGMVMRGEEFSVQTRRLGLRVQAIMGALSLVANVYAAHSVGGVIYGVMLVTLFLAAEWLAGRLESVQVDRDREEAEDRAARAQKAAATRKRNAQKKARQRTQEAKLLDVMVNG
jgi:hypothetical protein